MRALRFGELREGVWLRPANLDPDRLPEARAVVDDQCLAFHSAPPDGMDAAELAHALWDLDGWAGEARTLEQRMDAVAGRLGEGDTSALREGWELSAAVLRHLVGDPLLPDELVPRSWPGDALRATYDDYDRAFKATWRRAFRPDLADRRS
jgi:phenylacetic acid degradation operon negative regulatory protein